MFVPLFGVPVAPEILLLLLFFLLLPVAMGYFVYKDATDRGNDNALIWAVAVGGLTILTVIGGIIAFVLYFVLVAINE